LGEGVDGFILSKLRENTRLGALVAVHEYTGILSYFMKGRGKERSMTDKLEDAF
jgi:hypothetical protein